MPPGVDVEWWKIVSNDPLIIEYREKPKPTVEPPTPAPPAGGGTSGVTVDLAQDELFKNFLTERFIDPTISRDTEVLEMLRDTLRDYLKDSDPRIGGLRTPTAHGPSHAASGFDPVRIYVSQVVGLQAWIDSMAESVEHLQDLNGYFSEVSAVTGQLNAQVVDLNDRVQALSGHYDFLLAAFTANAADQRRLETEVHAVTASQEEIKTFLAASSAMMATIKSDFPRAWSDEFEATPELRYRLSHVPLADHPVKLWVGGMRNPRSVFSIEGQDLVFAASAAPYYEADGIKDHIVVDYFIPYQQ